MSFLSDEEFLEKVKSKILWEVFKKTKGYDFNFLAYPLTDDQRSFVGRMYIELIMKNLNVDAKNRKIDGMRELIDKIVEEEGG